MIVPFPAGSGSDVSARRIGQIITQATQQSVVIENKPGANGFIAAQAAATAKPDGYTLFLTTNTTHSANPALFKSLPYDPVRDFAPVIRVGTNGLAIVVGSNSAFKSLDDLISAAKKAPGKLAFGSGSSSSQIASEMLASMAGIKLLHVPYKGMPQALTDVMSGQLDFMSADYTTSTPLIQAGSMRALAVTDTKRNPNLPDVPTVVELGLPKYAMYSWTGLFAPAGTPAEVIDKINSTVRAGLEQDDVKDTYQRSGATVWTSTPAELGDFVKSEMSKWADVVKAAGIAPE
ncbi:tripartite tricarboxylate transporter substrate binding protein [Bradyrhizobium sp. LHD-71]|uniref:Bug family tripartite tricarboxylate transporter substrate binding protein n=1 Tax=Bradyrhizobium sp. LHD-71 TaxID=3072141 RepID=UPI00280D5472|nr:tripartite tricarboxylate transporter substrate binding protein [Bradyrhizobium sp. LHD-71]MDQ8727405.1 tripartite tricarboxylate transporter substrate binding protein [Bradyrhizobium sp. LHD-71]